MWGLMSITTDNMPCWYSSTAVRIAPNKRGVEMPKGTPKKNGSGGGTSKNKGRGGCKTTKGGKGK